MILRNSNTIISSTVLGLDKGFPCPEYNYGGVVFYRGSGFVLVAALDNLTDDEFGCADTEIAGANGTAIGTGEANTAAIVAEGCGGAALACSNLTEGGYSDWYLPSIDELEQLYLNRNCVTNLVDGAYWSSTQDPPGLLSVFYASGWNFSTGVVEGLYRTSNFKVRPIRTQTI